MRADVQLRGGEVSAGVSHIHLTKGGQSLTEALRRFVAESVRDVLALYVLNAAASHVVYESITRWSVKRRLSQCSFIWRYSSYRQLGHLRRCQYHYYMLRLYTLGLDMYERRCRDADSSFRVQHQCQSQNTGQKGTKPCAFRPAPQNADAGFRNCAALESVYPTAMACSSILLYSEQLVMNVS
jgi:hypothetical protein